VAVLGAAAGLEADDTLDLHVRSAPAHANPMGESQSVIEPVLGQAENIEHRLLPESFASLEDLLAGEFQDSASRHAFTSGVVASTRPELLGWIVNQEQTSGSGRAIHAAVCTPRR
jgi:hypothetical protein